MEKAEKTSKEVKAKQFGMCMIHDYEQHRILENTNIIWTSLNQMTCRRSTCMGVGSAPTMNADSTCMLGLVPHNRSNTQIYPICKQKDAGTYA